MGFMGINESDHTVKSFEKLVVASCEWALWPLRTRRQRFYFNLSSLMGCMDTNVTVYT